MEALPASVPHLARYVATMSPTGSDRTGAAGPNGPSMVIVILVALDPSHTTVQSSDR